MKANKKNTWVIKDKDGKIYLKSRTKYYLSQNIRKFKKDFMRSDLVISNL